MTIGVKASLFNSRSVFIFELKVFMSFFYKRLICNPIFCLELLAVAAELPYKVENNWFRLEVVP